MVLAKQSQIDLLVIVLPLGSTNTIYPPYGAMYIASALRQKGYQVQILNLDARRLGAREIMETAPVLLILRTRPMRVRKGICLLRFPVSGCRPWPTP